MTDLRKLHDDSLNEIYSSFAQFLGKQYRIKATGYELRAYCHRHPNGTFQQLLLDHGVREWTPRRLAHKARWLEIEELT